MSLNNINFTLSRFIIVIFLLVTLYTHGLTREYVWLITKNPLFSELSRSQKIGNSKIDKYIIINHQNNFSHIVI